MRDRRRQRVLRAGVVMIGLALAMSGPGPAAAQEDTTTTEPDGGGTTEAPTTVAPTPVPPTTEVPPTTQVPDSPDAPVTTEAPDGGDGEGDEGEETVGEDGDGDDDWLLPALIGAAALVVLVALAVAVAGARRRRREARLLEQRVADVVGRARWIHDEGAPSVLGASATPQRLQGVWDDTRRRMNDVAARASALAAGTADDATRVGLRRLSHAMGRLVGALDTHVSLHMQLADEPGVGPALEGAAETVMERRAELNDALLALGEYGDL